MTAIHQNDCILMSSMRVNIWFCVITVPHKTQATQERIYKAKP